VTDDRAGCLFLLALLAVSAMIVALSLLGLACLVSWLA
jgi:hypothetical protein